jgi:hypothetical protein
MNNNNNQRPTQTVSLDAHTMSTLVNMMRSMIRQELGSKPTTPNSTAKPRSNVSNAVSIRDEIRNIVRQELQSMRNQNNQQAKPNQPQNQPKQNPSLQNKNKIPQNSTPKPQIKVFQQSRTVQVQNKPNQQRTVMQVTQTKTTQQTQAKPNPQQQNPATLRITSVEQLAAHLQKSINEQLQKRSQMMGKPVQKNPVQVKIVQPQNQPKQNQQQKPVVNNNKPQAKPNQPQNNNNAQKLSASQAFAQKNVVTQKQAGDILSAIAKKVPKPNTKPAQNNSQNNQQKK